MAEKKMKRSASSSTLDGERSTVASEGWELDIESNELFAKLATRVAALETENKLLNEHKGLFFIAICNKCHFHSLLQKWTILQFVQLIIQQK
jgi:hypothetical protein